MGFIEIQNLTKKFRTKFGEVIAVDDVCLEIEKGEILTLLGPSGCGKTTTLRCIAGLERPGRGDVLIDGRPMISQGFVPPAKRGVGMVFQNYAVWPHMTVFGNVAYGLKIERVPKKAIQERVKHVLQIVGLAGLERRYPSQLSGGQQQRVALARSLVRNPKVLLLDEPLSNLDAKLREKMRFELKTLVKNMSITSVYVTHDQAEAMVISDRVAVMNLGRVVQVGSPDEIYHQPATRFVADFIGVANFLAGRVTGLGEDGKTATLQTDFGVLHCTVVDLGAAPSDAEAMAFIRPENVRIVTSSESAQENVFRGTVLHRVYLGNILYLFVRLGDRTIVRVQANSSVPKTEGDEIHLALDPKRCLLLRE